MREDVSGEFLAGLLKSTEVNSIIGECVEKVRRNAKKGKNHPYGFDMTKYFGGGIHYATGRYDHTVRPLKSRVPLPSCQSYEPEGTDKFFFIAAGYFDTINNILFDFSLPDAMKEENKELGFDTKPIGMMGTVYDKDVFILLWQPSSESRVSRNDVDGIMNLSAKKSREDLPVFFEDYSIPQEFRRAYGSSERLRLWELSYSYILAKGLGEKGYNTSVLRFDSRGVCPEDLKEIGRFAFGVNRLDIL